MNSGSFIVALKASRSIFKPVGRQVGRRHERPADALPGVKEFEHLLLLGVAREVSTKGTPFSSGCGLAPPWSSTDDHLVRNPIRPPAA